MSKKKNRTAERASKVKDEDALSRQAATRWRPKPEAPDYRPLNVPPLGSAQAGSPQANASCLAAQHESSPSFNKWNIPNSPSITNGSSPLISIPTRGPLNRKLKLSVPLSRNIPPWRIDKRHRYSTVQTTPNSLSIARTSSQPLGRWFGSARAPQPPSVPRETRSSFPVAAVRPLPTPSPDTTYLSQSIMPSFQLQSPQPLLLVLDLNGTLLYRSKASSAYKPRPDLERFLAHCTSNYKVLLWSSATPQNVTAICAKIFTPEQRKFLLGEWGRDTLDLTQQQYKAKVQVYKRLDRIWAIDKIQCSHPDHAFGGRWSQKNTLLLDDSAEKASAQPYNAVVVPEFVKGGGEEEKNKTDVLGQVVAYLETARTFQDVSSFARERPFRINEGWTWDWSHEGDAAVGLGAEGAGNVEAGVRI
ncbi:MAG: hypothetical protein L6R41_001113 [Letrouitia leprolyta]|nr:MAG: hypothetical protein L6R41_001113 [Letrouitia leprolyta]